MIGLTFAVALAGTVGQAHPPVPTADIAQWFGANNYPAQAIRAHEEGRVAIEVRVDEHGQPTACTVVSASGSPTLDDATCAIVLRYVRFKPAVDDQERPVVGIFPVGIRWTLPGHQDGSTPRLVSFAGAGDALTCSFAVDGVVRKLKSPSCRSIAGFIIAHGGQLDQPHLIGVLPDMVQADTP